MERLGLRLPHHHDVALIAAGSRGLYFEPVAGRDDTAHSLAAVRDMIALMEPRALDQEMNYNDWLTQVARVTGGGRLTGNAYTVSTHPDLQSCTVSN